ncbi:sugar phosphate isomerase/epimerase family protein [Paraburkholderia sacchari]|uniref:sugar phosphate isomerase/epimerase family protein n=1 Tax=Paraburkholderia sacchari TaxID=159450 RepID=UPI003D99A25E
MPFIQSRFATLIGQNLDAEESARIPELTPALARKLIERIDSVRLFAHAYTMLGNFTYGSFHPCDLLDHAYRHELGGICIHLLDGEERSLGRMSDSQLREVAAHASRLGLDVHLEISNTRRPDVDEVVRIARIMAVEHIRVYSRYEGLLSDVMKRVEADLRYLAELADRHRLHFYFEQHEELKSAEIVDLLRAVGHPRLHALFDFGNMINACESPMSALRQLAPYIGQVHMKGVRTLKEGDGFGHRGVLQGSADDDLPGARMLFELLMLGESKPQIVAFALEQENHYYAPMFRRMSEPDDPFIPYREMSETGIPGGLSKDALLEQEPRWAFNQIRYVRSLLLRLRELAELRLQMAGTASGC